MDLSAAKNMALNAALHEIDERVQSQSSVAEQQMGILMVAQALAFRRLLEQRNIKDRGRRSKMIRLACKDLESKLVKYGRPPAPADKVTL